MELSASPHLHVARTSSRRGIGRPHGFVIRPKTKSRRARPVVLATAVAVILAIAIVAGYWWREQQISIRSLAVIPFQTADEKFEYFGTGISEAIISNVSRIRRFRVLSYGATARLPRAIDARQAARQLHVTAVLTGRVEVHEDSVRVSAELVSGEDGSQLWGENYSRRLADVFSIQDEIGWEITQALHIHLSGSERRHLSRRYTQNSEAYQDYMRGRLEWNRRTGEALMAALGYYKSAIEKDPAFALPYAGLAECYAVSPFFIRTSPKEAFENARTAALKALELDEGLAEAHAVLATVKRDYDWDWEGMEREFRRSFELNPRPNEPKN